MDILFIIVCVIAGASLIAAVTNTPDGRNKWTARFYRLIDLLAINVGKAKQTGKRG